MGGVGDEKRSPRLGKSFSSRNPTPIGAIGLVLILALLYAAFNAKSLPLIGGGTQYHATFDTSANLKVDDDVRVAGVKVGDVTGVSIDRDHGLVKVDFEVKDGWIGNQSTAYIKLRTLLGAKYLEIDSTGTKQLSEGSTIPYKDPATGAQRTFSPLDVYPAFTELTDTIQNINTADLTKAFNTLSSAFAGTPSSVAPVVRGLTRLSTTIASRDAQLRTLLSHANQVTGVLAARDQDLQKILSDGNLLLEELNARRDAIHSLLINTQVLSTQLRGLVADNEKTLGPLFDNLNKVIALLEKNQDSLERGIALLAPFYRVFNNVVGNGRWFDNYVQNLSAVGVVGTVLPSGQLMAAITKNLSRGVVVLVVAAVVAGVVYFAFLRGSDMKTVSGKFSAAVGVYPGTPVKILGVNVGDVTSVKPEGSAVVISMEYDASYKIPRDSHAILVANSLVSDRYVQLDVYKSGPVMPDHGTILDDGKHTLAPAELDDIYAALNKLSVALGPKGANAGGKDKGALSTLLRVSAANLKGNGAALGQSISKLADAAQTLSGARGDLFQTVGNLRKFTEALKSSDAQVRRFNAQLAQVAGDLADERTDLGAALHDLTLALDDVNSFIKANRDKFHTSVVGLENITGLLVRQKAALNETLAVAPFALANIVHAYQPNLGVIATRGNLSSLTDPGQLCTLLKGQGLLTGTLLGPLTSQITTVCNQVIAKLPAGGLPGLGGINLGGILSGQLPSFPIGGN